MKLEDMIMVVENQKGTETNFLMDLTDYMKEIWSRFAEPVADAIGALYKTKEGRTDWSDLYFAAKQKCTCIILYRRAAIKRIPCREIQQWRMVI